MPEASIELICMRLLSFFGKMKQFLPKIPLSRDALIPAIGHISGGVVTKVFAKTFTLSAGQLQ